MRKDLVPFQLRCCAATAVQRWSAVLAALSIGCGGRVGGSNPTWSEPSDRTTLHAGGQPTLDAGSGLGGGDDSPAAAAIGGSPGGASSDVRTDAPAATQSPCHTANFEWVGSASTNETADLLSLADMNGDSILDAIVAFGGSGNVGIVLGQGGGVFFLPFVAQGLTKPSRLIVANLCGDANPDILVASEQSGTVVVLEGHGNGTASPCDVSGQVEIVRLRVDDDTPQYERALALRTGPATILPQDVNDASNVACGADTCLAPIARNAAVGDFDHDHLPDLWVERNPRCSLQEFVGGPDSSLAASVSLTDPSIFVTTLTTDLDSDGWSDLVSATSSGKVLTWRNDKNGRFLPAGSRTFRGNPIDMRAAQLNDDSYADLALVSSSANTSSYALVVAYGTGDGGVAAAQSYPLEQAPRAIAIGDLDADGRRDLLVAVASPPSLSIWMNRCTP